MLEPPVTTFRWLPRDEVKTRATKRIDPSQLSSDQAEVFSKVLSWYKNRESKICSVGGYAGTGKTTITSLLAEELVLGLKKSVAFLTPTAKASCVLKNKLQASNLGSTYIGTVHRFMYVPITDSKGELIGWRRRYFEKQGDTYVSKNDPNMPKLDLIVVDESSMVPESMEEDIASFGVPVLAVGDHGQLPPVIGRSTWMRRPTYRLEKIHRQAADNPVLALATYVREQGRLPQGFKKYSEAEFGVSYLDNVNSMIDPLFCAYALHGQHETAVACYTNRVRCILNTGIYKKIFPNTEDARTRNKTSAVEQQPAVTTKTSPNWDKSICRDTQVICLKNNDMLVNGMRGFVESDPQQEHCWLTSEVSFPDEGFVFKGPMWKYQFGSDHMPKNTEEATAQSGFHIEKMDQCGAFMDYGYAMTVHKLQGSSVEELFIVLEQNCKPTNYDRWLYTAITRASEKLNFVESWI